MDSEVASDGPVCCFSFNTAVWRQEHTCHEPQTSIPLSHDVRLDISVVVLASPDEASTRLQSLSNHIVDESVFVSQLLFVELWLVILFVDFLENIFESSIILL